MSRIWPSPWFVERVLMMEHRWCAPPPSITRTRALAHSPARTSPPRIMDQDQNPIRFVTIVVISSNLLFIERRIIACQVYNGKDIYLINNSDDSIYCFCKQNSASNFLTEFTIKNNQFSTIETRIANLVLQQDKVSLKITF